MTPKEEHKHTDLLPLYCPFCRDIFVNVVCATAGWLCKCNKCFARTTYFKTREEAITAWNTRKADCHEELDETAKHCLLMAQVLRSRKGWATQVSKVHGDSISADFEAAATYMEKAAQLLARATNHQESGEKK